MENEGKDNEGNLSTSEGQRVGAKRAEEYERKRRSESESESERASAR